MILDDVVDHKPIPSSFGRTGFLADVEGMFMRAVAHLPMQDGFVEKIRACNETYSTRFGVRLRGRIHTFEGWRSVQERTTFAT